MKKLLLIALLLPVSVFSQTWIRCSSGLPTNQVLSLTQINGTLIAGTDKGGVFKSSDGGNNWTAMPTHNSLTQTQSWSIAAIDTFVYAAQRGGGVLKCSLNGSAWSVMNSGLGNKVLQDILAYNNVLLVATYGGGVYSSTDYAATWAKYQGNAGMEDPRVFSLCHNTNYYFAGTAGINTTMPDTGVAYRHPINGNSWTVINNGFIRNGAHLEGVFSMDADDQVMFAGTDDVGIFRSTDLGATWTQVHQTADVHSIKVFGQYVYYGTSYSGVYSSSDQGLTWKANNSGLVYNGQTLPYLVKDFQVMGNYIYAATDMGVFKQLLPNVGIESYDQPFAINCWYSSDDLQLHVTSEQSGKINMYNVAGQLLRNIDIPEGSSQYNLFGLTPGIYVLEVNAGGSQRVQKLQIR